MMVVMMMVVMMTNLAPTRTVLFSPAYVERAAEVGTGGGGGGGRTQARAVKHTILLGYGC